jgi:hypothetical protein
MHFTFILLRAWAALFCLSQWHVQRGLSFGNWHTVAWQVLPPDRQTDRQTGGLTSLLFNLLFLFWTELKEAYEITLLSVCLPVRLSVRVSMYSPYIFVSHAIHVRVSVCASVNMVSSGYGIICFRYLTCFLSSTTGGGLYSVGHF